MRFLVIGASGFVGRYVLATARARGHAVIGTRAKPGQGGDLMLFNLLEHRIKDCVPASFIDGSEPAVAVICVKFGPMDRYVVEPRKSYEVEVEKTVRLIGDLFELGVKPVALSTVYVFDGKLGYYNESQPHSPISAYGKQKAEVEDFLSKRPEESLVLRLDKVVGDNPSEDHLLTEWYKIICEGKPIPCIEGQIFSPTLVNDVAKGVVLACELGLAGVYHLANSEFFLRDELARQFARALQVDASIACWPQEKFKLLDARPLKSYADSSRFTRATGMRFTTMHEAFENFVASIPSRDGSISATAEPRHPDKMKSLSHRDNCRLCSGKTLDLALPLAATAIGDAYVSSEDLDRAQEMFPLDVYLCRTCGHAQLLDVINPTVLFGNYLYSSCTSPGLLEHFRRYVDHLVEKFRPRPGDFAVDIGSNDGSVLQLFKAKGLKVLGIDPAAEIARKATEAGVETLPLFFDFEVGQKIRRERGPATMITANNVYAHSDDLAGMTDGVRELLAPDGVFAFEVSYLVDIVQKGLFDTIYHEHLSYHAVKPLDRFLRAHGLELIDVERIPTKGGSIRGMAQRIGGPRQIANSVRELVRLEVELGMDQPKPLRELGRRLSDIKSELHALLSELKQQGKVIAGYGASPTVTTLVYHFDLGRLLEFLVDDNVIKQGKFSPGYHLPVLPSQAIYDRKADYVVILAWAYEELIRKKHSRFSEAGGHFVVPMPRVSVW